MHYQLSETRVLNHFYKLNKDKARAKPNDLMYAAISNDKTPCAALRLLPYEQFLFLRSVLTSPDYRGQGIASALIQYAINQNSCPIYTLPTPLAVSLYKRLGFIEVEKQEIPAQLLASYRRFRQADNAPTVMVINLRLG
jgi:N-acetylglutamate synthase-like GNAT family acetyltransferase